MLGQKRKVSKELGHLYIKRKTCITVEVSGGSVVDQRGSPHIMIPKGHAVEMNTKAGYSAMMMMN